MDGFQWLVDCSGVNKDRSFSTLWDDGCDKMLSFSFVVDELK